ncbi:hypothetical protein FRB93_001197 [Tulasnella sp. JGI-2019a]|nr:hypothetical protein FRB93_001197 [Tulasnella sp. JGI-2019a]
MAESYARTILDCFGSLDWAMQVFQFEQHIDLANRLHHMSQTVHVMHNNVKDVQITLQRPAIQVQNPQPALPSYLSVVLPPKPAIFHGRDDIVQNIVLRILPDPSPRFALLGPGGVGKTSVALAVAGSEEIVRRFGSRRSFVRCDEATSLALFLELIARAVGVDKQSDDRLQDIMASLQRETQPRFLILDNFETPWDIPGHQSDLIDILSTLSTVPHLGFLITMRGVLPDPTRMGWTKPELPLLEVLSVEAARTLYLQIHPKAEDDQALCPLLTELSHMPLAVTLMATAGSNGGETPSELLARWRAEGTGVVHQPGSDRRMSVPLSIELSLHSNVMNNDPDALRLLSILSFLPEGVNTAFIPKLAPSLSSPSKARASLLKASLIYSRSEDRRFHVLSPIRSHVTHNYPMTPEQRASLFHFYFNYIQQHLSKPGDPLFLQNCQALVAEETNIETILFSAIHDTANPSRSSLEAALEAALKYAIYQYRTYPRTEIITAAVTVARRASMNVLLPRLLMQLGDTDRVQGRYAEARGLLVEAREGFQQLKDDALAAQCLRRIGQIDRVQGRFSEAVDNLRQAQSDFLKLDDAYAAASCLKSIGDAERMRDRFLPSRIALEQARAAFKELKDSNGEALATRDIGDVDRLCGQFADARVSLRAALEQFRMAGSPVEPAYCLRSLGEADVAEGNFDDARRLLTEAFEMFERVGDPRSAAHCLRNLGLADLKQGNVEKGRLQLESAREAFEKLKLERWATWCRSQLGVTPSLNV